MLAQRYERNARDYACVQYNMYGVTTDRVLCYHDSVTEQRVDDIRRKTLL